MGVPIILWKERGLVSDWIRECSAAEDVDTKIWCRNQKLVTFKENRMA
jgi:hypothetical protein